MWWSKALERKFVAMEINPFAKKLCSYGDGATHLQWNFVPMEINQQPILQRSFVPMEIQQQPICKRSTLTIVGDTAAVPELAEEDGALVVDGLDNGLPSLRLLLGPDSGRVGEALVSDGNTCGFRDDQTSRCCTLWVVQSCMWLRNRVVWAASRQRRHHHSEKQKDPQSREPLHCLSLSLSLSLPSSFLLSCPRTTSIIKGCGISLSLLHQRIGENPCT